jgi:patatin-like phospholipase/acyl hydrolase
VSKFQILAIDGGGMRGLFPAGILARLEETFGIRIADCFDLIAGTSTGGIIALGIGKGLSPAEIENFYLKRGPRIFAGADSVLRSIAHIGEAKYDTAPLQKELRECFGDTLLGESQKRLVVTSYDMENDDVRLMKTAHHARLRNDYKLPMWQVALATSAAPTYFSACKAIADTRLVDGGVWANNPTMVGLTEAISLLKVPLSDIRILSIGTSWELKQRPETLDHAGKWGWKSEIVDVMFRGQSHAAVKQAQLLLDTPEQQRVLRLDFPVPEDTFDLDRVDLNRMMPKIEYFARHFGPKLEEIFFDHQASDFEPSHKIVQTQEIIA